MKHCIRDKSGNTAILFLGMVFLLLMISMLVMELGGIYNNYDNAKTVLQRTCNNTVERLSLDSYRADRETVANQQNMVMVFRAYARENLPKEYDLTVGAVYPTFNPAGLKAEGTVTIPTIFSQYGFEDVTIGYSVQATNMRLDE